MSCILGIASRTGRPVAADWQPRGLRAMLPMGGTDGVVRGDRAALAWRQFVDLPEDRVDRQPMRGGGGRLVMVFDGRLDNRAELLVRLGRTGPEAASMPDGRVALRCFEAAGREALGWFCGAFALALFDEGEDRLLLARDALGMRPLVYHLARDFLRFATVPRGLFVDPSVPRALDPVALARHSIRWRVAADRTIYQDIRALPPGCFLEMQAGRVVVDHHWRPDHVAPVRFARMDDYAEGLRAVLETAVAAQTRSARGVASQLSGGLDSSAVTALAAGVLAARNDVLDAYTAAPPEGTPPVHPLLRHDESGVAAETAARFPNIRHHVIRETPALELELFDRIAAGADLPPINAMNMPWFDDIARAAGRRGAGVLLHAGYGNLTISAEGFEGLADMALRGRFLALARHGWRLRDLNRIERRLLVAETAMAARRRLPVPAGLRRRIGRRVLEDAPVALRPEALPEGGLDSLAKAAVWRWPGADRLADGGRRVAAFANNDLAFLTFYYEASCGLSLRDPTADQRVAEYCWGLPPEAFLAGGTPRGLVRRAMAGLLPPAVVENRRQGAQAVTWRRQMSAARDEILREIDALAACPDTAALFDIGRLKALAAEIDGPDESREMMIALQVTLTQALNVGRFARRFSGSNQTGREDAAETGD
ncbi:asparagine synthetase B [Tistrella mobilis]|uniref:asparagine synthetase B family protein n=1 Tax=Tistrella mobilis TaxID=171437 RepID=UPI00269D207F